MKGKMFPKKQILSCRKETHLGKASLSMEERRSQMPFLKNGRKIWRLPFSLYIFVPAMPLSHI